MTAPTQHEIQSDEGCIVIDADCPNCGWPERITPMRAPGTVFGCRKCQHESPERDR